jgi:hypothetical protein
VDPFARLKRTESEADQLPPCSAGVKNAWTFTSVSIPSFVMRVHPLVLGQHFHEYKYTIIGPVACSCEHGTGYPHFLKDEKCFDPAERPFSSQEGDGWSYIIGVQRESSPI